MQLPLLGHWSDCHGRRPFFLLAMLCALLPLGVVLAHLWYGFPLKLYYVVQVGLLCIQGLWHHTVVWCRTGSGYRSSPPEPYLSGTLPCGLDRAASPPGFGVPYCCMTGRVQGTI